MNHRLSSLALALAPALLAGCTSLTALPPSSELLPGGVAQMNASRSASVEPGLAIQRWWTLFDDAELNRLIEKGLAHNTDLAIASVRLQEAQARLQEVHAARLPNASLQASHGRARSSADVLPPGAARTNSAHALSIVSSFEVDLWGRFASADDAARARLQGQAWARAAIEWSLTAQLADAHFTLRTLQRQVQISESVRESRARSAQLRQREHAAGATSEFELRRAEAELVDAELQHNTLQRHRIAVEHTLALLSGRSAAEISAEGEAAREPLDLAHRFALRLPQGDAAALLLQRPDVKRAEAELLATRADIRAARAATLPALRLSGSVGSDSRELAKLFSGPGFVWSLAAGLTQSLFDGGAAQARVDQAQSKSDVALLEYRRTVAGAVLDLREAYANLDLRERALAAEQQRVAVLERSYQLAQSGVSGGALSRLDLLDAERNSFQAQLSAADAYRERLLGQVAAFKALGGGHSGAAPVLSN